MITFSPYYSLPISSKKYIVSRKKEFPGKIIQRLLKRGIKPTHIILSSFEVGRKELSLVLSEDGKYRQIDFNSSETIYTLHYVLATLLDRDVTIVRFPTYRVYFGNGKYYTVRSMLILKKNKVSALVVEWYFTHHSCYSNLLKTSLFTFPFFLSFLLFAELIYSQ